MSNQLHIPIESGQIVKIFNIPTLITVEQVKKFADSFKNILLLLELNDIYINIGDGIIITVTNLPRDITVKDTQNIISGVRHLVLSEDEVKAFDAIAKM